METSMLTHPTHERLITLGLTGMAKALQEQRRSPDLDALSFEERVGLLVDREAAERDTKRLTTRLKFAALRQSAQAIERQRLVFAAVADALNVMRELEVPSTWKANLSP